MKSQAKILVLGASIALSTLLLATPADAHKRHDRHGRHPSVHHHRSHGDHDRHRVRVDRHRRGIDLRFRAPVRLHRRDVRIYRPYYRSSIYYRSHRHHHAVYDFPVHTRGGYVYRSHYYCDGSLFTGGRIEYHGRRVSFGFDF